MSELPLNQSRHSIRARVSEFSIPPIRDGLVLGRRAPIGCVAIRGALQLLTAAPFEHIEIEDEVIGDILVRTGILRRMPKQKLIDFILKRIKPLMGEDEILHLEVNAEVTITEEGL